jgi:hypothetical protein
MAYFPDLSPYSYGGCRHEDVLHVGWLDNTHPFPQGALPHHLIAKIKALAANPVELYRGVHLCELCAEPPNLKRVVGPNRVTESSCEWAEWAKARWGNGEIRVRALDTTFAAPVLIVHYIEAHAYLPPEKFLQAVEAAKV